MTILLTFLFFFSGTGKSSILKLISGLLLPSDGEVLVRGVRRQHELSKSVFTSRAAKVAVVFQNPTLFDSLSVAENVGFELLEHSTLPEHEIIDLVAASLGRVGIKEEVMWLLPAQLSGGMQKRVSFARAVTYNPKEKNGLCRAPDILLLVRLHGMSKLHCGLHVLEWISISRVLWYALLFDSLLTLH